MNLEKGRPITPRSGSDACQSNTVSLRTFVYSQIFIFN